MSFLPYNMTLHNMILGSDSPSNSQVLGFRTDGFPGEMLEILSIASSFGGKSDIIKETFFFSWERNFIMTSPSPPRVSVRHIWYKDTKMHFKYKGLEWAQFHRLGLWNPPPLPLSRVVLNRPMASNNHHSTWVFYYWLPVGVTATAEEKRSSLWLFPLSPGGVDVDWNLCNPCVVDSRMRSSSSLGGSEAWSGLKESDSSKGVSHMFAWGRLFLSEQSGLGVGVRKGPWAASVMLCTSCTKILWPRSFWWGKWSVFLLDQPQQCGLALLRWEWMIGA